MRRLSDWIVYKKEYLTLAGATVISLILIFSNDHPRVHTIRGFAFGTVSYVLEKVSLLTKYDNLYQNNRWLRAENARLMLENSRYKEALYENQRLKALLNFQKKSELILLPARVIGRNDRSFIKSIVLDVGSQSGIEKDMAVVTSQGLVGRVFSVTSNNAIVQLMQDRNFRVSSTVRRSRVSGITRWFSGNDLVLAEVPKRSDVNVGDFVVTSGLSTIFPGGLEIGQVREINDEEQGMFMTVLVRPSVHFSKLEEVFVVTLNPTVSTK